MPASCFPKIRRQRPFHRPTTNRLARRHVRHRPKKNPQPNQRMYLNLPWSTRQRMTKKSPTPRRKSWMMWKTTHLPRQPAMLGRGVWFPNQKFRLQMRKRQPPNQRSPAQENQVDRPQKRGAPAIGAPLFVSLIDRLPDNFIHRGTWAHDFFGFGRVGPEITIQINRGTATCLQFSKNCRFFLG